MIRRFLPSRWIAAPMAPFPYVAAHLVARQGPMHAPTCARSILRTLTLAAPTLAHGAHVGALPPCLGAHVAAPSGP